MKLMPRNFQDQLHWIVLGSYVLILTPWLTEYIEQGSFPDTPRAFTSEVVVSLLIIGFILLLRRTRREILLLNEMRQNLTDSIVHDLKNPLATIMGSLSALRDGGLDAETHALLVELSLRGCRRQVELIDNLLDTGRLENARLPLDRTRIKVRALLEGARDDIARDAEQAEVSVAVACGEGGPDLEGDRQLLGRVLMNLLWNALKYTPRGGRLELSARWEGRSWELVVHDTGAGIPQEHLQRLFQKYYRVEGEKQTKRRGTGVGLFFCRLVVEAHGGRIVAASEIGEGTTVTITLPGSVLA